MTYTHPVVGYCFPAWEAEDERFDPVKIASEVAALDAEYGTEEFDDLFDELYDLTESDLLAVYQERCLDQ